MINAKNWHLNETEYGKVCGGGTSNKLKVWVPKILPFISFSKPKSKVVPINKSCIINDSKCKPIIASSVKTVNYITIPHDDVVNGSLVEFGTRVVIKVKNNSPDQLTITHDKL